MREAVILFNLDYARSLPLRRVCSGDGVPAADSQAFL